MMIDASSKLRLLYHYFTTESKVWPTLLAGATVQSHAATDWAYGTIAVIVPANQIASRFHIHNISVESCDKNGVFQLALYRGATENLIATVRFSVIGGFWGNSVYVIASEVCAANDQIRAKLAYSDVSVSGQATMTLSVCYCIE
jgi:hypothetical protein